MNFLNQAHLRFVAILSLVTCLLSLGTISPAAAEEAKISDISQEVFDCRKRHTEGGGGWITYNGDNSGRINVYTGARVLPIGVGEVGYNFDPDQKTLTVTSGSGPAPFEDIRNGLNDTANKCRSGEFK